MSRKFRSEELEGETSMWLSVFDDVYGRALTAEETTIEKLFERVRDTHAASKSALPLLKLARLGSLRTPQDPTNPKKGGSLRHDKNVLTVSGIEGDYDGESMPFSEAVARLEAADVGFIAYTSPSHTDAAPRWRVLLPFATEHPPGERGRYLDQVNGILGGVLSRESWALSQCFFFGGIDGSPAEAHLGDSDRCIDEGDFEAIAQPYTPKPGSTKHRAAPALHASRGARGDRILFHPGRAELRQEGG